MKTLFQTGIIDVGAHAVRLELFDVRRDGRMTQLESLCRAVPLGSDVFRGGYVTPETAGTFAAVMTDYAMKLREYGITSYRAFATSAIREASNRELVIDRVRHDSGLQLEILESAQEVQSVYLAMRDELRRRECFDDRRTIGVFVGSGSLFVVFAEYGRLCFCEEIPLGTDRMFDRFGRSPLSLEQFTEQLHSQNIPQRLAEAAGLSAAEAVDLVALGAAPRLLMRIGSGVGELDSAAALALMERVRRTPIDKLAPEFGATPADAAGIAACAAILGCFLTEFNCAALHCLSISTREAMVAELLREREHVVEPFRADLLSLGEAVGRKYGFDAAHAREVARLSGVFFYKLRRSFSFAPRAGMLLEVAALLHDIGRFVDARNHHEHSCYLISGTQLPGLSAAEHRIVALTARCHRAKSDMADSALAALAPEDKVTVLKLAAILRVADALDCARRGRFRDVALHRRNVVLELRAGGGDFRSEKLALELKGTLFSQVFGIKVKIEEVG